MESKKAILGEKLDTSPLSTHASEKPETSEGEKESEGQIKTTSTMLGPNDEAGNLKEEEIHDISSTKDITKEAEARECESIIKDQENYPKEQLKKSVTELDPNEETADSKEKKIQAIFLSTKDTTVKIGAYEDEEKNPKKQRKSTVTELDPNEVTADIKDAEIENIPSSRKYTTIESKVHEDENIIKGVEYTKEPIKAIATEMDPNEVIADFKQLETEEISSTKDTTVEDEVGKYKNTDIEEQIKAISTQLNPNKKSASLKKVEIKDISLSTKETTVETEACEGEKIIKDKEIDPKEQLKATVTELNPNEEAVDLKEMKIQYISLSTKDTSLKFRACEDKENDPKEQRKSIATELDPIEKNADLKEVEIQDVSPSKKDITLESKACEKISDLKELGKRDVSHSTKDTTVESKASEDEENVLKEQMKSSAAEMDPNEVIADLKQLETQDISSSTKDNIVEAELYKYKTDLEEQIKAISTQLNPKKETADLKKLEIRDVSLSTKETTVEAEACEGEKIVKDKENDPEEKVKATPIESEPSKEFKDSKKAETQKTETESLSEDVSHVDIQKAGPSQQNLKEEIKGGAEKATTTEDSLATKEKSHYENQDNLIEELKKIMVHVDEIAKRENIKLD